MSVYMVVANNLGHGSYGLNGATTMKPTSGASSESICQRQAERCRNSTSSFSLRRGGVHFLGVPKSSTICVCIRTP